MIKISFEQEVNQNDVTTNEILIWNSWIKFKFTKESVYKNLSKTKFYVKQKNWPSKQLKDMQLFGMNGTQITFIEHLKEQSNAK